MSENELIRFIKDRFTEMEKERTALISDIKELAKESGKNLATANERIGTLNVAISNIIRPLNIPSLDKIWVLRSHFSLWNFFPKGIGIIIFPKIFFLLFCMFPAE